MSRVSTLSQNAIREFYSPNSIDNVIILVTFYDPLDPLKVVARVCDGWTQTLTGLVNIGDPDLIVDLETDRTINAEDVIYGVIGPDSKPFIFLPLDIVLPDETEGRAPRASITIYNATR